ncbi:hypothetical protein D7X48_14600 [bacterium D16-50]|nr:hypothetical protein D7X48_14600 [bacterium D16-50]
MKQEHTKDTERRQVLKALGFGGLAVACASFLPKGALTVQAAGPEGKGQYPGESFSGARETSVVADVKELKALTDMKSGAMVQVLGYDRPGDMGAKRMVYFEASAAEDNGGTVHRPASGGGAWHVVHDGVGRFGWFGIFDASRQADDALDALVGDESFHRIEADSDLLMRRRHIFHRSNLELDFHNYTCYTYGAENAARDNPFAAMMFFQGEKVGEPMTVTLPKKKDASGFFRPALFGEDSDYLYVGDNSGFAENQWYFVQSDPRPQEEGTEGRMPIGGGSSDIELMKLVMVTKVGNGLGDKEYIGVNYLNAWPLATGRQITYQRIRPVFHVNVRNLKFEGQGHSDVTGTSPVAHEFCVDCNVENLEARKVFWPLDIRRYCTTYEIKNCELINPEEVKMGGTGYMVQQIGCLYGHVVDCRAHNVRHLNDFTGCAFSMVENCHCTGDENGAFVTHGQYDHDLTYIGNSGFLSFANSALSTSAPHTWGGWHKRILVKKHIAPRIVFQNKMNRVVDMTLEDCYVYRNTDRYGANGGSVWANVDGLVMKNCVMDGPLSLGEDSSISKRATVIEGCTVNLLDGFYLTRHRGSKYEVDRELTFRNCTFRNVGNVFLVRCNRVNFESCHFFADPEAAASRLNVEAKEVVFRGGGMHGVCFAFDKGGTTEEAVGDQRFVAAEGARFDGSNSSGALFDVKNNGHVTFEFGDAHLEPGENTELIRQTPEEGAEGNGTLSLRARGTTLVNAALAIPESARGEGSYYMAEGCILKNSSLHLPGRAVTANNLEL